LKLVLTLKHRVKASFGNEFKELWFYKIVLIYGNLFADGIIAATVIDAQVNYELPKLKSTLKLGASNIGGIWTSIRAGLIGQQYFASGQLTRKTYKILKKNMIMIKSNGYYWFL
jgi:hypothetical protein